MIRSKVKNKKITRTIEFVGLPAIGIMVGTDHFDYSSGKTRRTYVLMLPFVAIKLSVFKKVFNTVKESK